MDGIRLNDLESLEAYGVDKQKIVEEITRAYAHQIYIDGFFNGDPHPGILSISISNMVVPVYTWTRVYNVSNFHVQHFSIYCRNFIITFCNNFPIIPCTRGNDSLTWIIIGNFLVSKESPHRPILLDFGLTKKLSNTLKQALAKMFLSSVEVGADFYAFSWL